MSKVQVDGQHSLVRRFKPYPAYTDSNVEWLGTIPTHWDVRRLRATVDRAQNGAWGDEPDGSHDIGCVRVADFDRVKLRVDVKDLTMRSIDPKLAATRRLGVGDLLLEKSGGGENQPVGAVVLFDHAVDAVCSNFISRITIADGHDAGFLTYLHACLYAQRINTRHIKQNTGIQNLDSSSYFDERIALPPNAEQLSIVRFLDRETARIDALVAKKERLIELLQDKRTALITHAVTKGLEPNVPMKYTGIQWLGEIPANWQVKRLKHLALHPESGIQMGPFGSMLRELTEWETGYKLYGQENTISGDFEAGSRWLSVELFRELADYSVRERDIVITRKGSLGNARLVPHGVRPGIIDSDTIRVRVDMDAVDPSLIVLLLHEAAYVSQQIGSVRRGAVLGGLNTTTIADLLIAVPPRRVQTELVRRVRDDQDVLDRLVTEVEHAIERLREFRTALISAAVTGKIDVREEAA